MRLIPLLGACALIASADAAAAAGQEVVRHGREGAMLLESVEVGANAKFLYIGGQAASPLDPNDRSKGFGDTQAQTIATLNKIKAILERRGYSMSDVIKLNIFVAADPALGKADYAGVNAAFKTFFGTTENPNTVVRTALEIKALQLPGLFVEIEGVAAH